MAPPPLRERAIEALRLVFGLEREERSKALSPSAEALRYHSPSMFSVYSHEDMAGLLTISQTLMDRYADYEAMEEYPDINCLSGDQHVFVADGSIIRPVTVRELAMSGGEPQILAFDEAKQKIVKVAARQPRLTGHREILHVRLRNGCTLKCTPDHKVLTTDGYVDAKDLRRGVKIRGMFAGFNPTLTTLLVDPRAGVIEVAEAPTYPGGEPIPVFDITTDTHNFICEGVVVHNSALHYFADNATQPNIQNGRTLWVVAESDDLTGICNDLLHKRLRLEDEIWSMAYTLAMFGNLFLELLLTENGVIGLNNLPVPTMRRVERLDGGLVGYVQDITGQFTADSHELRTMLAGSAPVPQNLALFEDWQVIHARLTSSRFRSPYGVSTIDGARWIWRRLVMLDDSVMIYRLTRAPARYAVYVDVTDIASDKIEGVLENAKREFDKKKLVNPRTGRLDLRYNPINRQENFFIAVREGRELARVETMAGPSYDSLEDIDYFKRMLHGVLKVPRAYLGQDDPVPGKGLLSNDDARAAKVTLNLQRELRLAMERLCRVHLASRGVEDPWEPDINVEMTVPSGIYELAAYEVMNARVDYASRVQPFVSTRWIQENILKLPDEVIKAIEKQQKKDAGEEQAGDVPSYATGGGGGGQMPPVAPSGGEEEPGASPEQAEPEPEEKAVPQKSKTQADWKRYDKARRIEEWRYQESCRRHQEIVDKLETLMAQANSGFARREHERRDFFRLLQDATTTKSRNGHSRPAGVKLR